MSRWGLPSAVCIFVAQKKVVRSTRDGSANTPVVHLLFIDEVITAWNFCGVKVLDIADISLNVPYDIPPMIDM